MTIKELKEIIKGLPDDTEIEINSVWDENLEELTPSSCSGFYHEADNKVYLTPDIIAMQT